MMRLYVTTNIYSQHIQVNSMPENLPADDNSPSDELNFAADADQRFNKMILVGDRGWVRGVKTLER
jgi:hypothetical protein